MRVKAASLIVLVILLAFAYASGTASRSSVLALSTDWESDGTDVVIGPIDEAYVDESSIRWEAPSEIPESCADPEVAPVVHWTEIRLNVDEVPDCGISSATYVSSIYPSFCASMEGVTTGDPIGSVAWYHGVTLLDTTTLKVLDATTGYSSLICPDEFTYPTKAIVTWGAGVSNPAVGEALEGFELLVSCCNLR